MVASSPTIHQPLVAKPKTISNHNLLDFSAFLENTSFPVRQKKSGKNTEILHHRAQILPCKLEKEVQGNQGLSSVAFFGGGSNFCRQDSLFTVDQKKAENKTFSLPLFSLLNSLFPLLSKWQQIKDCEIVDIGHPTKDRISKGHRARVKAKSSVTVFDSRENCLILDQLKFEETSEARTETIKSRTFQPKLWPFPRSFISKWQ